MNNFALFANTMKSEAVVWAEKAAFILNEIGANCFVDPKTRELFCPEAASKTESADIARFDVFADMVVVFGGDGTMLSAARQLAETDVPLMGVNVGKLGFLAEFSTSELREALTDVVNGNFRIVDRALLQTEIDGRTIYALNEFVIERDSSPKTLDISLSVNNYPVADYRCDGIIVSTPTGSTAYSLSCGGPVIAPAAPVISITPISAHLLTIRPLVIPDTLEVEIEVIAPEGNARLTADGFVEKILKKNEKTVIRSSERKIKLVKHISTTYFDLLRAKLLWSAGGSITKYPDKNCSE